VQRYPDSPCQSAIERLRQHCFMGPFGDHMITAKKNRVGPQERVWVEFLCLSEEFREAVFVVKFQSESVVFETEFPAKRAIASSVFPFFRFVRAFNTTSSEAVIRLETSFISLLLTF
jgi:hypothetical protein